MAPEVIIVHEPTTAVLWRVGKKTVQGFLTSVGNADSESRGNSE